MCKADFAKCLVQHHMTGSVIHLTRLLQAGGVMVFEVLSPLEKEGMNTHAAYGRSGDFYFTRMLQVAVVPTYEALSPVEEEGVNTHAVDDGAEPEEDDTVPLFQNRLAARIAAGRPSIAPVRGSFSP